MLTPFQQRIAAIVAGLDEAEDFALARGGALIVRGDVDRGTRDLDFFGLTIESVDRLAPAVERAFDACRNGDRLEGSCAWSPRNCEDAGQPSRSVDLGGHNKNRFPNIAGKTIDLNLARR
jgi:hypothetical protein